jgi:adenylyltransferase/sulfurtransferase
MLDRSLRDRYSRQTIFPGIGEEGQARLLESRAVVIGCGALGGNIAHLLVRAGVGDIRIIDRDFIEPHNLQRQVLFDEEDIRAGLPKAIAAERRLRKVNSTIKVQGIVADINYTNIEDFCRGADVILDGLDNAETRYLINDVALKQGIPWVYGGAIAANGMTMTIIPGETPCFRCISPDTPADGPTATCETAGIVGTVPAIIGALQATEAMKIIIDREKVNRDLIYIDVWEGIFDRIKVSRREGCPACGGKYEFLGRKFTEKVTSLCGQSRAIQVLDTRVRAVALDELDARLGREASDVSRTDFMLSFRVGEQEIMVFPDGRAIIKNTIDDAQAKELYRRYVKSKI